MFSTDTGVKCPHLLVFAGPNGSGKSTVTKGMPIVGLYVNAVLDSLVGILPPDASDIREERLARQ